MAKRKILLHAGLHKTGTTAIQRFCSLNRAKLYERGIWYPDYKPVRETSPESHHGIASTIAGEKSEENLSRTELEELLTVWKETAGEQVILLSSEKFCRFLEASHATDWKEQRTSYLTNVAGLLNEFDVEPIVVLRRQDNLIHSSYLENLKKGTRNGARSFAEFREISFDSRLRFYDNLDVFRRAFGDVRVLTYEDLKRGAGLYQNFFTALGCDLDRYTDPGIVGKSMGYEEGLIKQRLNKVIWRVKPLLLRRIFNRAANWVLGLGPVRAAARRLMAKGKEDFWETRSERDAFVERFTEENDRIRKEFLPERSELYSSSRG